MLRRYGYGKRGEKIVIKGQYVRKPRVSILCFLGVDGIQECYNTAGTFDRDKFFGFCRKFALSGKVEKYPGRNSVWILDGARIHCHEDIVTYLRMLGIRPIFLPPYCPFFNPIEYLFGMMKKKAQLLADEKNQKEETLEVLCKVINSFMSYDMSKIFENCGYSPAGYFDPGRNFQKPMRSLVMMISIHWTLT
jgi:hypothetical protein